MSTLLLRRLALLDELDRPAAFRLVHNGPDARGLAALLADVDVAEVARGLPLLLTVASDELDEVLRLTDGHAVWLLPDEDDLAAHMGRWRTLPSRARLVVGDPVDRPGHALVDDLADAALVDAEHLDVGELTARRQQLRVARMHVVGVHRIDLARRCRALGAELLSGRYLSDVGHDATRLVQGDRLTLLQLMALLQQPDASPREVTTLVERSPALSFELLRWVNSAHVGLRHAVDELGRAVGLLGPGRIRQVASLLLTRELSDRPEELTRTALLRARMCDLVGGATGDARPAYYVVGLFSMLDALLEVPLDVLVGQLPLTEEVGAALLHHDGRIGRVLQATKLYEHGHFDDDALAGFDPQVLASAYLDAMVHADGILQAVAEVHAAV